MLKSKRRALEEGKNSINIPIECIYLEKMTEIERENRVLLEKISKIMVNKSLGSLKDPSLPTQKSISLKDASITSDFNNNVNTNSRQNLN